MKKILRHCERRSRRKQSRPSEAISSFARRLLRRGFAAPRNDISRLGFFAIFLLFLASCNTNYYASPTPVVAGLAVASPEVPNEAAAPTLEPFRFDLPTPGAAPVSGWRPPLYPVPWAIAPYDHFYFTRPIAANQVNWPLADYRYGGVFFANVTHVAIDIDAPLGTPVLAAGPGTVVWADWGLFRGVPGDQSDEYGMSVAIRMDFGYKGQQLYTAYSHLSKIMAVLGQRVQTGDVIGLVGSTGNSTGPHLNFEVRFPTNSFWNTYNPELWIAPPEGWGVLAARVADTNDRTLQSLEVYVTSVSTNQTRMVRTYGPGPVNSDPVYNENMVLGDLAAGLYKVSFNYKGREQQEWVNIYPGRVTYFTFRGELGFNVAPPPTPKLDGLPTVSP